MSTTSKVLTSCQICSKKFLLNLAVSQLLPISLPKSNDSLFCPIRAPFLLSSPLCQKLLKRASTSSVIGTLRSDDGKANENVALKYNFVLFVLLRDYFNSFNIHRNGKQPRTQIGKIGPQVKKENEKFAVVFSRSPQNLEFGHFRWLFCSGRQGNVPKFKTHVQSDCLSSLKIPH